MPEIRRMRPDDAEGMESAGQLIRASFQPAAAMFDINKDNYPTYPAFLPTAQLSSALMAKRVHGYGMYQGEELIGFFMLRKIEEEGLCDLSRFCVEPRYQGKGNGSHLLEYAALASRELGAQKLHVGVIDPNIWLKEWFQKRGFVPAGSLKYPRVPVRVAFFRRPLMPNGQDDM